MKSSLKFVLSSTLINLQSSSGSALPNRVGHVEERQAKPASCDAKVPIQQLSCKPPTGIGNSKTGFAKTSGRLFDVGDGAGAKRFAGANAYYLGFLQDDSQVDTVLHQMAESQVKVARVWGFSNDKDNAAVTYQSLQSGDTPVTLNCDTKTANTILRIPRLDYVIQSAEKNNVKLVLPLLNGRPEFGGVPTYASAFGGTETSFWTDEKSQAALKSWVTFIVNRYKDSPALFAWELANEPRCTKCDTSTLYNWASDMSAYIKCLDPNHMVTFGDEGWLPSGANTYDADPKNNPSYAYRKDEGIDFQENLNIKTLDYGTFHQYPTQWEYQDDANFGSKWIADHNTVGKAAGKPVVLEEYASAATDKTALMRPWQTEIVEKTNIAMDMFWHLFVKSSDGKTIGSNFLGTDGYPLIADDKKGSDYDNLVTFHAPDMLARPGT